MSAERLLLSEKYKAFLRCNAPVEFLEGTTAAGKTTVGLFKFMLKVAESPKKLHIIAAKDTGTAEKNIINKDLGIIDDFGVLTEYNGNGTKDDKIPHILFHTSGGDKVVSQIETISKARQGQIMSVDAAVDELYGDDKDDIWKQEEIKRLKEELGIGEVEEPGVHLEAGGFKVNTGGDGLNDSNNRQKDLGSEPKEV